MKLWRDSEVNLLADQVEAQGGALHSPAPVPQDRTLTAAQEVEAFWTALHRSWNIEPREYFEAQAPKNGFESALAMAVHYMWKREVKLSPVETCTWRCVDPGRDPDFIHDWISGCGEVYYAWLDTKRHRFCHFCGKTLVVAPGNG